VSAAAELPHAQTVKPAAHHALHDLRPLELGEGSEHRKGQLVFGILDVVLAAYDDLLVLPQELVHDDPLVLWSPGYAISGVKIDGIEKIGL
jgi:hypothetical protein